MIARELILYPNALGVHASLEPIYQVEESALSLDSREGAERRPSGKASYLGGQHSRMSDLRDETFEPIIGRLRHEIAIKEIYDGFYYLRLHLIPFTPVFAMPRHVYLYVFPLKETLPRIRVDSALDLRDPGSEVEEPLSRAKHRLIFNFFRQKNLPSLELLTH